MTAPVTVKNYKALEINRAEIVRYAGCRTLSSELDALLDACLDEVLPQLRYQVCWTEFQVNWRDEMLDLSFAATVSAGLRKNLDGCSRIVLFAATVGLGMDRLISRYGRVAPTRALLMQAIGTERIEALCNAFEQDVRECCAVSGLFARPRFSPGYGDLPLALQRDIFQVLNCQRKIGLTLNDSLLMSPSKSVTAIIGLAEEKTACRPENCSGCDKADCEFRRKT